MTEFRWGLAANSIEVEGLAPRADWTLTAARWPPGPGWDRWLDEFSDAAPRTLTDVRITLEWSRIEPTMERPDLGVVEHLRDLLGELRNRELRVWATLHHGSLPGWFAVDEHGFADKRSRTFWWPRHIENCGQWFGDLVDVWVPIDEPIRWANAAQPPHPDYLGRNRELIRDTLLAELTAARILVGGPGLVATAHELRPPNDEVGWCWTRALAEGVIDVPGLAYVEASDYPSVFNIVGVTHRTPATPNPEVGPFSEAVERVADAVSDAAPNLPIVVVSHGLETPHDNQFAEWADQTAEAIDDLVADGLPLEGWFAGRPLAHPVRGRGSFDD